ncbi:MAG: protein kinase [Planctomycetota bacterium]
MEGRSLADALGRVAAGGGAVEIASAFAGGDGPSDRPERARRREIAGRLASRRSHLTPLLATFAGWARALDRAHAAGVVHGGLAPEDLLLDAEGRVGIRGFGDSPLATGRAPRSFPEDRQRWFAPEYLDRRLGHPSYLSDVHAFGLVLASALALDLPRWEEDGAAALERSTRADLDLDGLLPRGLPAALIRLLESCVSRRPENRPRDLGLVAERLDAVRGGGSPRRPGSLLAVVLAAFALAAILFLARTCSN